MPTYLDANFEMPAPFYTGSAFALQSQQMDVAGEMAAVVLQAPKTGNIRKVSIRWATVTTPTDTDVRIESVGADGNPSGALIGTNTNATLASGSITSNTVDEVTLTADAAVTKGQWMALVLAPTGTPNMNAAISATVLSQRRPFSALFSSSAWVKASARPAVSFEYDDGSFGPMLECFPTVSSIDSTAFGNGSTPDEKALEIFIPLGVRVIGLWFYGLFSNDFDAILYDEQDQVLASQSWPPGVRASNDICCPFRVMFDADVELNPGWYKIAAKPTTASTITLYTITVPANTHFQQMEGGVNSYYTERTDGGAWTDTKTARIFAGLICNGLQATP